MKMFPFYDIICLNSTFLMIIVLQPTRMRYIQCPHRAQNSFERLHCIIFQKSSHPSIIHKSWQFRSQGIVGAHGVLYQLSGQHLTNMRVVLFRLSHNTTWEVHLLLNRIYKMIQANKSGLRWGSGMFQCFLVHVFGQSNSYLRGCLRWRAIYRVIHHHVNKKTELHYSCQLHECTS